MRLFLIPGLGEMPSVFDRIEQHLPYEKVFIDNWVQLGTTAMPDYTVLQYAKKLIALYQITSEDVIIGHSMGGWIAFHIKHVLDCRIVQIGSWTDIRRVKVPFRSPRLAYWVIQNGLHRWSFVSWLLKQVRRSHQESLPLFLEIYGNLVDGNQHTVMNQLYIIFNEVCEDVTAVPELRIHARQDKVVGYPREDFVEVPGDHFTLHTYPSTVYEPILALLKQ